MLIFAGVYLFYWSEKVIVLISDYRRLNRKELSRKSSVSSGTTSSTSVPSTPLDNKDGSLFIDITDYPEKLNHVIQETIVPNTGSAENTRGYERTSFTHQRHPSFSSMPADTTSEDTTLITTKGCQNRLGFHDSLHLSQVLLPVSDTLSITTASKIVLTSSGQESLMMTREDCLTHHHNHHHEDLVDVKHKPFRDTAKSSTFVESLVKTDKQNVRKGRVETSTAHQREEVLGSLNEEDADVSERKNNLAWMVIIGDAIHNLIDGLSLGAALADSHLTGFSIAIAILFEEIPHELGDMSILLSSGMSRTRAAMFNFMSASSCYLGMMIGIISGDMSSNSSNSYIFAVAAGMFLYISLFNIMTDLNENFKTCRAMNLWTACEMLFWQNLGVILGVYFLYSLAKFDESLLLSSLKIEL